MLCLWKGEIDETTCNTGDGSEIFFVDRHGALNVASIETEPPFRHTDTRILFEFEQPYELAEVDDVLDITSDGQRFLAMRWVQDPAAGGLVWVQDFFEELERLVPR